MEKIYEAGKTKDNKEVFFTEWKFNQFSSLQKKLISEALPHINHEKFPYVYTFHFNRIVGKTSLVEVENSQKDRVFWVYRNTNPRWRVPLLIGGTTRATTKMTITFQMRNGKIFIVDCFFGDKVFPLPGNPIAMRSDRDYYQKCKNFWQNHALAIPIEDINIQQTIEDFTSEEAERFVKLVTKK